MCVFVEICDVFGVCVRGVVVGWVCVILFG